MTTATRRDDTVRNGTTKTLNWSDPESCTQSILSSPDDTKTTDSQRVLSDVRYLKDASYPSRAHLESSLARRIANLAPEDRIRSLEALRDEFISHPSQELADTIAHVFEGIGKPFLDFVADDFRAVTRRAVSDDDRLNRYAWVASKGLAGLSAEVPELRTRVADLLVSWITSSLSDPIRGFGASALVSAASHGDARRIEVLLREEQNVAIRDDLEDILEAIDESSQTH